MDAPKVKQGEWISIQGAMPIQGYVISVLDDGLLSVGYAQSSTKAVKENVIWSGTHWAFQSQSVEAGYLDATTQALVLRGKPQKP